MAVKGKVSRREPWHREAGLGIAEIGRIGLLLPKFTARSLPQHDDGVPTVTQRGLQRVDQPLPESLALAFRSEGNTVDHRLNGVLLGFE